VSRPRALIGISQDSDGVLAAMDDGSSVRARFAVGADGMRSAIRHAAGIGFSGGEYAESFLLADVRLTGEAPDDQVVLLWAKAGLTVVAPMPGGIYRIVAPMADAPETPSLDLVQALLDDRGFGTGRTVVTDLIWGSRFRIHHRVADTYHAGRLLLAGDAAHVHSPAGGQGMNLGIQDAVALGDALIQALSGSDAALDAYGPARRAIAGQVLALTGRLTTLATMPSGVRPARNLVIRGAAHLPAVRRGLAMRLSGLVYR
jgi:2-polyprenyl-6-methoxyphenol hydroxylase-like FAD-dependent oxidoreductase